MDTTQVSAKEQLEQFLPATQMRFLEIIKNEQLDYRDGHLFSCITAVATTVCGLKQGSLAHSLNVGQAMISRWATGHPVPYERRRQLVEVVKEQISAVLEMKFVY